MQISYQHCLWTEILRKKIVLGLNTGKKNFVTSLQNGEIPSFVTRPRIHDPPNPTDRYTGRKMIQTWVLEAKICLLFGPNLLENAILENFIKTNVIGGYFASFWAHMMTI